MELMGPAFAMIAVLFLVAIFIAYLGFLHAALRSCAPGNRALAPGLVWLMLVPGVGLVWQFVVNWGLQRSFGDEFRSRGARGNSGLLNAVGIAKAIADLIAMPCLLVASLLYFPTADVAEGITPSTSATNVIMGVYTVTLLAGGFFLVVGLVLWVVLWAGVGSAAGTLRRLRTLEGLAGGPVWPAPTYWPAVSACSGGYCRACGGAVTGGRFCGWCGTALEAPSRGGPPPA